MPDRYVAAANLHNLNARELWRFTRSPVSFLLALLRFRVFRQSTTYAVAFSGIPETGWTDIDGADEAFADQLEEFADDAAEAGLCPPLCNESRILGPARGTVALCRSPDGDFYAVAIMVRNWESGAVVEEMALSCMTAFGDGTSTVTSSATHKFDNPHFQNVEYRQGAS